MTTVEDRVQEQTLLRKPMLAFLEKNVSREVIASLEADERGFSPSHWNTFAVMGVLALLMPESMSATTSGVREMATIAELLGEFALPSPLFAAAVDAAFLVGRMASPSQQAELLPLLASGEEIVVVALSEPGAAPPFRPLDLQTTARRTASGWILRGRKAYVPFLNAARRFLCVARVGEQGISIFQLPHDHPGLSIVRLSTTNHDPLFAIELNDVLVPEDSELGQDYSGSHVSALLDIGAALKAAELVGIGRRVLALTREYAVARIQFGVPIGSFQAVQHHLADMYRLIEQARVLTDQAVGLLNAGIPAAREVSLAKIKASEGVGTVLNLSHQIHGGVGFYIDYPLEAYFRRTVAAQSAYGSALWHRRRLGDLLLADPDEFRRRGAHTITIA